MNVITPWCGTDEWLVDLARTRTRLITFGEASYSTTIRLNVYARPIMNSIIQPSSGKHID